MFTPVDGSLTSSSCGRDLTYLVLEYLAELAALPPVKFQKTETINVQTTRSEVLVRSPRHLSKDVFLFNGVILRFQKNVYVNIWDQIK